MEAAVLLLRDAGITTEYKHFVSVLKEFGREERLVPSELARRAKLSQGQAYRVFRDAKSLGLLKNGDGLSLTPLGWQWLREANIEGLPAASTVRQAALNVPLFAQAMRDLRDVSDPDGIMAYFCRQAGPEARTKDLGCARRRYLEAFYPASLPTRYLPKVTVSALPSPSRAQRLGLATAYSNLIQTFGEDAVDECHAFFLPRK